MHDSSVENVIFPNVILLPLSNLKQLLFFGWCHQSLQPLVIYWALRQSINFNFYSFIVFHFPFLLIYSFGNLFFCPLRWKQEYKYIRTYNTKWWSMFGTAFVYIRANMHAHTSTHFHLQQRCFYCFRGNKKCMHFVETETMSLARFCLEGCTNPILPFSPDFSWPLASGGFLIVPWRQMPCPHSLPSYGPVWCKDAVSAAFSCQ